MAQGRNSRRLTQDEAALLAVVGHGGVLLYEQIALAMGESAESRKLYRRARRLRGLPPDGGLQRLERMREAFPCPVCRKRGGVAVTRAFSHQRGTAVVRYQHYVPAGETSERHRCTQRMSIAEGEALRREQAHFAVIAPEPALLRTVGTPLPGGRTLAFGLSNEGVQALLDWCDDAGVELHVRSPEAEGWRFIEHSIQTSEVYVRALVATGCAGRPWAFPARWQAEPGTLKWTPMVRTAEGRIEEGKFRYVRPDATMLIPPTEVPGLEMGRRVFIEVERGTQALTDPNLENAGAVESKLKRYESFCCFAPVEEGPARSYYRRAFPDDRAEPWLVVVADEKRKRAILRALGSRVSLTAAGFHGFRSRVVSFEEVGSLLAELAGATAKASGGQKGAVAPEEPEVRLTHEEGRVFCLGVVAMRRLYEQLRERVRAFNADLPPGATPIPIESTPVSWTAGARPIIDRLLQVTVDEEARQKVAPAAQRGRG